MFFRSINGVFEIAPPITFGMMEKGRFRLVNNRDLPEEEMMYIRCRGLSITEQELLERATNVDAVSQQYSPEKRLEEDHRRRYEKVKSKVISIHNYKLEDGQEITDFDGLVKDGCPELVKWLFAVLCSGELLSRAERKNFLPVSDSPS